MTDLGRPPNQAAAREAARFARLGSLEAFLFRLKPRREYCLTLDPTGGNLPDGFGSSEWVFVRRLELLPSEQRTGFDAQAAADALLSDGYALIGCPFHDH